MIVNANPANPPYSILALQRIWIDTKFSIDFHRHSTVLNTVENKFEEKLLVNTKGEILNNIDVKLIWKDGMRNDELLIPNQLTHYMLLLLNLTIAF